MDRTELLNLIRRRSREVGSIAASDAALGPVTRRVERELLALQGTLPPPSSPLPTVEQVAAFVEGEISEQEEQQLVRAAVHDSAILAQLINEVLEAAAPSGFECSPELVQRIVQMHPGAVKPSESEQAAGESLPLTRSNSQQPDLAFVSSGGQQPVNGQRKPHGALVTPSRISSRRPIRRRQRGWQGLAMMAAFLVILVGGVIAWRYRRLSRLAEDAQLLVKNEQAPGTTSNDLTLQAEDEVPQLPPRDVSAPPEEGDGITDDVRQAVVELERVLASGEEQGPNVTRIDKPFNAPADNGADSMNRTEASASVEAEAGLANHRVGPVLKWKRILGVVARHSGDTDGYDRWYAINPDSERSHQVGAATENEPPTTWMTLPESYAEAELSGGGRLVLGASTNLVVTPQESDGLQLNVLFGAVALVDIPSSQRVFIHLGRQPAVLRVVQEPARLWVRRTGHGLRLDVAAGSVAIDGTAINSGDAVVLEGETVAPSGRGESLPAWAVELPKESGIPRQILANLDTQADLAHSIDQELVRFGKSLDVRNPTSVRRFYQLCQMRAHLGVDDPLSVVVHPVTGVRLEAWKRILGRNDDLIAARARRALASRFGIDRAEMQRWMESVVSSRNIDTWPAGRWLNMLDADDPVAASLGDFMLRRSTRGGPNFNPASPVNVRRVQKELWRRYLATARRTRSPDNANRSKTPAPVNGKKRP